MRYRAPLRSSEEPQKIPVLRLPQHASYDEIDACHTINILWVFFFAVGESEPIHRINRGINRGDLKYRNRTRQIGKVCFFGGGQKIGKKSAKHRLVLDDYYVRIHSHLWCNKDSFRTRVHSHVGLADKWDVVCAEKPIFFQTSVNTADSQPRFFG